MDEYMADGISRLLDKREKNPIAERISKEVIGTAEGIINLLFAAKKINEKMMICLLITLVSGLTMALTDNVDEALAILEKSRKQIIDTEKEINKLERR